jgi:hypothetical protein
VSSGLSISAARSDEHERGVDSMAKPAASLPLAHRLSCAVRRLGLVDLQRAVVAVPLKSITWICRVGADAAPGWREIPGCRRTG